MNYSPQLPHFNDQSLLILLSHMTLPTTTSLVSLLHWCISLKEA